MTCKHGYIGACPEGCDVPQDETESVRRAAVAIINADPGSREALEKEHGQVWDTSQLGQDFVVQGFMAPFVVVRRKSDNMLGSLVFQHSPRFYYGFTPDK
jgi:hypothetical protein